jgi:ADP-ribosyl-[dinitrogen reductase] hydrolase
MSDGDACHDRILGALLGLAIGDALGGPIENLTPAQIVARFPNGIADDRGLGAGDVTDDTEMARLVALSLIERRQLDMEDIAARLVRWADGSADRLGPSTSRGVQALKQGVPWWQAGGASEPSSGALPRCAPLGLTVPAPGVVSATVACCLPTHRHPLAIAAAVAQNLLLCQLLSGVTWSDAVASLESDSFDVEGANTIRSALATGTAPPGAVAVLAEAIACVARASTARTAFVSAIALGGDTDTRGATTGVLAGTRWGAGSLPRSWETWCSAGAEMRLVASGLTGLYHELRRRGAGFIRDARIIDSTHRSN